MNGKIDLSLLLPREPIRIDLEAVRAELQGRRVLVTGAAGSIGSELCRQLMALEPERLVMVDQAESALHALSLELRGDGDVPVPYALVADCTRLHQMQRVFAEHRPEVVFHAAAYKHVPLMQLNPHTAIENNIGATMVLARLAVEHGVRKFVMVSTDKAVNPTGVMGHTKRVCELVVRAMQQLHGSTAFVTTRFGNVLGSVGSVVPLFLSQIETGGPLTVTHPEVTRFFMLIPEACQLVLAAATMGCGGEIFLFDMGEPVRIADLAQRLIGLCGSNAEIVYTGLRPGEKLYEEVLAPVETTLPSRHPKIRRARVPQLDAEATLAAVERLLVLSRNSHPDIIDELSAIN